MARIDFRYKYTWKDKFIRLFNKKYKAGWEEIEVEPVTLVDLARRNQDDGLIETFTELEGYNEVLKAARGICLSEQQK